MALSVKEISDRPHLGILMMLVAWCMFSLVDTSAKWLVLLGVPAFQLAFMRYAGHLAISLVVIGRGGIDPERFRTDRPMQVIFRSLLLVFATLCNFFALNYLPLTMISAIMFSSPVIVCFLSGPVLGERVGPWRWFAIVLGFIGVVTVVRPFGAAFHPAMLLSICSAFSMALYFVMTRKLAGLVATDTQQFYTGAVGALVMLPLALATWQTPQTTLDWALLIGLGVFAWTGHQLLTVAHRFATANTLTPYTYSYMIYMSVLGFLVFGQLPDGWTLLGAAIIVTSGLIIWSRERRRKV